MKTKTVIRIGEFMTAASLAIFLASVSFGSVGLLSPAGSHPLAAVSSGSSPDTNGWG
jgi:hypothetical protein